MLKLVTATALALAVAAAGAFTAQGQTGSGSAPVSRPAAADAPPIPPSRPDPASTCRKLDRRSSRSSRQAIADKKLPGAVVLDRPRRSRRSTRRRSGSARVVPAAEAMTLDTIFDLASLTKVVATTTSVMKLVEDGRIRLNDRVATFIPGFERYGKADITIRHLMTHTSGLRPDLDLGDDVERLRQGDRAARSRKCRRRRPASASSTATSTSSCSATSSGASAAMPLDRFAKTQIFEPLGMKDTMFLPPASLRAADRADREVHAVRLALRGRPTRRCSAASCTIRRRGAWAASPDTPACSAPPPTCRSSAACCSAAASTTARASSRR